MSDVRDAGDRHVPALARAVQAAIQRVRDSVSLEAAEEAAEHQTFDRLVDWSGFWTLTKAVPKDAETVIYEAIVAGAKADGRFTAQLQLVNQAAVDMARRQAAELVVGLSREAQGVISEAVAVAVQGDMTVKSLARTVRSSVGLTPQQAAAVANYRVGLQAAEAGNLTPAQVLSRWSLSDRLPAMSNLSVDRMDDLAERYAQNLLRSRATTIARTESLRAAHMGQKELWNQAMNDGLLPPDTGRVWQTTADDRGCDLCSELGGQVVPMDGEFSGSRGETDFASETPPIHPNCRCTESLDFGDESTSEQDDATEEESEQAEQSEQPDPYESIRAAEDEIRDNDFETLRLFDENGVEVFSKVGDQHEVAFTPDESALFRGRILTHNHPFSLDSALSPADLEVAARYGLAEMRAVARDWDYSVGPIEADWRVIREAYERHQLAYVDEIRAAKQAGTWPLSLEETVAGVGHEVVTRVASEFGFTYLRTAVP